MSRGRHKRPAMSASRRKATGRPGDGALDRAAESGLAPSPANPQEVERLLVRYQLIIRRRWPVLLLSLVSMLMLSLSFEPFNLWWLAWVALVPWILAVVTSARWGWMLFCSWLAGFLFFSLNLYWLLACGYPGPWDGVLLMALAELALSAYMGLYFLLFAYVVGGLARRWDRPKPLAGPHPLPSGLLMTYVVPIAWVGTEVLRGYVLSGFPWFLLAHSHFRQIILIQIADLGGAYVVSFLIAAANGLIADGMLQPLFLPTRKGPRPNYQVSAAMLAVMSVILLTVVYGRFRVEQFSLSERAGPVVGVIQGHHPVTLADPATAEHFDRRFAAHLGLSAQAARSWPKPEVVVWPETMTSQPLNSEFVQLFETNPTDEDQRLLAQVREHRVALLVGSVSVVPNPPDWIDRLRPGRLDMTREPVGDASYDNPQLLRYNSAVLYQPVWPAGRATTQPAGPAWPNVVKSRYDKHHLVPFGELIPFRRSWPAGFRLLRRLTPMSLLVAGENMEPLTLTTRAGQDYRFATLICYEDVMPQAVRRLACGPDGRKRIDFLANISNDGWFAGTTEPRQHWAQAVFRCIEVRAPMLRSVNGGCSGVIDPVGRSVGRLEPGVTGYLVRMLPRDDRQTVYCRVGDVPAWGCAAALFAGLAVVMIRRRRAKRANKAAR